MPNPNDFSVLADGTEQNLYNATDNRVLQAAVNVDVMESGDTLVVREYKIPVSGGALLLAKTTTLTGVDGTLPGSAKLFTSDPMSAPYGGKYTIQQTAGTNRTYVGSVDEL